MGTGAKILKKRFNFKRLLLTRGIVACSLSLLFISCSVQFFRDQYADHSPLALSNAQSTVLVGSTYSLGLSGGVAPYVYQLASGNGSISDGIYTAPTSITSPDADGTEHVVISVRDSKGKSGTITLYVMNPLELNSNDVDLEPGDPFAFSATGGKLPYTFSVLSGLGNMDASSGAFTAAGSQGVSYGLVTDADGNTDQAMISIYWDLDPTVENVNVPVNGTYTIIPSTGKPNYGFAVTSGLGSVLPATGATSVFTAPAVAGLSDVTVTDARSGTKVYTINSYDPLTFVPTSKNVEISDSSPFGVSGGVPPYNYTVQSGASSGSIDSFGVFTATATSGTVVVQVEDSINNTATATVNVYDTLTISPTSISIAVNVPQLFSGGFGVPPYTYSKVSGVGAIDPTTGEYVSASVGSATLRVTDAESNTADATVTVSNPLTVPASLTMQVGNVYTITPTGGEAPYSYVAVGCAGIGSLSAASGATSDLTALATGSCSIDVTDSSLPTAQTSSISVQVNPVITLSCSPTTISAANTSTCTAGAGTGVPGYTYSVVGGATNGTVTAGGVYTPPATPGTYTIQVDDSFTPSNTTTADVTVNAAISLSPSSTTIQVAQTQDVTVSGGVGPFTFTKQSGPADASVTTLSGTSARGSAGMTPGTLVIQVTDSLGNSTTSSIGIGTPPAINAAPAARNIHMTQANTITPAGGAPSVNGGATTYAYSIVSGGGGLSAGTGSSSDFTAPGATGSTTIAVDDGVSTTYNIVYTIIPDLTISPTSKDMMVGTSTTFTASNVVPSASFSVETAGGGSIVAGTGVYTAPGTVPGTNPITVRVTDGGVQTADALVTIYAQLVITPGSGSGDMLVNGSQVLNITGGVPPYTFSLSGSGGIVPSGAQGAGVTSTTYTAPATATTDIFTVTDSQSPPNSVDLTLNVVDLVAPTSFTATGVTATSVNTSWNAVSGATSYEVQVNSGGWTDIGNVTTHNFSGLTTSVYTLEVRAKASAQVGSSSTISQAICSAGSYAALGAGSCTFCPGGEYTSTAGQTSCSWCDPGTYATGPGATSCTNCGAGVWVGAHSSSCSNACTGPQTIGNFWVSGVNTSASTCAESACSNKQGSSTYVAPYTGTSSACNYACNSGYGSSACTQCGVDTKDGTVGGQEACAPCSSGQYSAAGSTSCSNCTNKPSNASTATYSSTGGGVNQCPYTSVTCNASYEWNGTATYAGAACNACSIGQWSSAGGSCAACTNNTSGFYWTSNGTSATGCTNTACTNKLGTSTYIGHGGTSNSCAYECNSGYGSNSCTGCGAGTWDSVTGGKENCASCDVGKYSTGSANASCSSCANVPGGNAGSGATSIVYASGNTSSTCDFTSFSCPANSTWNGSYVGGSAQCNCNSGYGWNGSACQALINCYTDVDGDGYRANTTVVSTTFTSCPSQQTANTFTPDCCDTNGAANPGVSSYFTSATTQCGTMTSPWDYNCSGSVENNVPNGEYIGSPVGSGTSWMNSFGTCMGGVGGSNYYGTPILLTTSDCGTNKFTKISLMGNGGGSAGECTGTTCTSCTPVSISYIFTSQSLSTVACH